MKSYSLFGVLGMGSAAALALVSACTVTTINNGSEGGITGDDGSTADGSSSGTASSSGSSSGATDGATEGATSSSSSSSSGGDGGSCSAMLIIGAAACDTCMKANCCADLIACDTPTDAGVTDAGLTECETLLDCTLMYSATADAGLTESLQTCAGGDASTGAPAVLNTLLNCASAHCAADCQ